VTAVIEYDGKEINPPYTSDATVDVLDRDTVNNVSKISEANEAADTLGAGYRFTVEGVVTSNTTGYDSNTGFFDCVYIQDETGGLCIFPVSGTYKVGDRVRVTGHTDFYQGERELQVVDIEWIEEAEEPAPREVTAKQINDCEVTGELISLTGTVESYEVVNGLIQTIMVKDENGDVARVFIDGYICKDEEVQNLSVGAKVNVVGLASYDDTFNAPEGPFPRIRIRDRKEIRVLEDEVEYHIIEGADSSWYKGSTNELLIASDAPNSEFVATYVDGKKLSEGIDYRRESGSTRIYLFPSYLESLSGGAHSIEIGSKKGSAYTKFYIKTKPVQHVTTSSYVVPETGDR
ncbi:MAG: hypothetical protein J5796_00780, partial [Erysipelotrichaceae bacterium]|nr:hypothetical protein [Erysipelotrichaceae bacterium]